MTSSCCAAGCPATTTTTPTPARCRTRRTPRWSAGRWTACCSTSPAGGRKRWTAVSPCPRAGAVARRPGAVRPAPRRPAPIGWPGCGVPLLPLRRHTLTDASQESPMWSKPRSIGVSSCAHPHSVQSRVPGFSATFRTRCTSSSGAPSGASSPSGACSTPRAGPRPSRTFARTRPEGRRSPNTSRDRGRWRRRKRLGGDLVVVDAVHRPHVLGRPDPHPVPRGLHTTVLAALARRQSHEVHPTRLGLPPPPPPRHDLLLRVPEHRVGGQHDPRRHRPGRVIGGCGHAPTVSTAAAS